MKKKKQYIISFLIPIFIFLMVCQSVNLLTNGSKYFLISDSKYQYISLFSYFKNVLTNKQSLFYSFSKGLGGNMIGTYAYYLASPLNLLIIFFSKKTLIHGMLLITTIKIGLSGLMMYSYLKKRYKNNNDLYLFSTCYALMGYVVVYMFNIMWLDALYLAPLLLIGVDKIIKNQSSLMYGFVLFIAIISNYYTGYMLCILSVFYLIHQIFINHFKGEKKTIIRTVIKFSITSLLAGIMSFVILMPTIYELIANVERLGTYIMNDSLINNDFMILFARFLIGSHNYTNVLNLETPAIYSSIFVLPLIYFYFINSKIKKRDKLINGTFLILLISGFFINFINNFWHGFSVAHGFSFRYTFLLSMFLIILSAKSFRNVKHIKPEQYYIFLIFFIILSIITMFKHYDFLNIWFIVLSNLILILYLLLIYCLNKVCKKDKKLITFLIFILLFAELLVNFYLSIYKYEYDFKMEYNDYISVVDKQIETIKSNDNTFYRLEKDLNYSLIDSMLFDYNGVSLFLSTINKKTQQLMNNLGHHINTSVIKYKVKTSPITDALFGIKYIISNDEMSEYELIDNFEFSRFGGEFFNFFKGNINVYKNNNALSLGYMVDSKINDFVKAFKKGYITNVFDVQNHILKMFSGNDDEILIPYNVTNIGENEYIIDVQNDNDIYLVVPYSIKLRDDNVSIFVNDKLVNNLNYNNNGSFMIKNNYKNEKIKVKISSNTHEDLVFLLHAYYLDNDNFLNAIEKLKENQLQITKFKNHYIKGHITVPSDKQILFTTIPYEKGWSVLVDGEKVDYNLILDSLISINLTEGHHEIEFKFTPPLFKLGLILSLIGSIIFALFIKSEDKVINCIVGLYDKYEEIINYLIIGLLTTIVSISTYAIFTNIIGLHYIVSSLLSFVLAVIFAFFSNKLFVFKTDFQMNIMFVEMYQFVKYRILSLGIDLLLMILMVEVLHINDLIAKILVQVVVVVINYIFSKLFVFKK